MALTLSLDQIEDPPGDPWVLHFSGSTSDPSDSYTFKVIGTQGTEFLPVTVTNPDAGGAFQLPPVDVPKRTPETQIRATLANLTQVVEVVIDLVHQGLTLIQL